MYRPRVGDVVHMKGIGRSAMTVIAVHEERVLCECGDLSRFVIPASQLVSRRTQVYAVVEPKKPTTTAPVPESDA